MTAIEQAEAARQLPLSTFLRFVAILLGIASATLMATKAFGFTFDQELMMILKGVENFVGAIVWPIELVIVRPLLGWLSAHGVNITLNDNWKSVFVLFWLYFGADVRSFTGGSLSNLLSQRAWKAEIPFALKLWTLTFFCALLAGVLSGTVSLDDPVLFWGAAAIFFLRMEGGDLLLLNIVKRMRDLEDKGAAIRGIVRDVRRHALVAMGCGSCALLLSLFSNTVPILSAPTTFWWPFFVRDLSNISLRPFENSILLVSRITIFAMLGLGVFPALNSILANSPSPGIATITAIFAILSVFRLLRSARENLLKSDGSWQRWLDGSDTRSGLDVLAVLGGTAAIVYVAHQLS